MFIFAANFGSRSREIKRESGEIIIINSRTVPATVSYNASCTTSIVTGDFWEDQHEDASQETCLNL